MRKKKKNNCRIFYDDERSSSFIGYDKDHPFLMTIEKGDILTMTVNMEEFHMTWFINEICVQRTFFEKPTSNIYPFVKLSENT